MRSLYSFVFPDGVTYLSLGLLGIQWFQWFLAALFLASVIVIAKFRFFRYKNLFANSCIYTGRVKHSRLKGEAMHKLDYPIFFTLLDLEEMEHNATPSWLDRFSGRLWPIFQVNASFIPSFCSLDSCHHLKGWEESNPSLWSRLSSFVAAKSNGALSISRETHRVRLMSHLTYFGYCFNPVSFYYISRKEPPGSCSYSQTETETEIIVTEVSNTPWIEQHSYLLHESVQDVQIKRGQSLFDATWVKEFHVSPFMEMDYIYNFVFSEPGGQTIAVQSRMIKRSTKEVWFTASFQLNKLTFSPVNLLYVLVFYPLHTRMIQLWIHVEAVKLWWKGVSTYEHPHGTDVDFGFGVTGKRLGSVLGCVVQPVYFMTNLQLFQRINKSKQV